MPDSVIAVFKPMKQGLVGQKRTVRKKQPMIVASEPSSIEWTRVENNLCPDLVHITHVVNSFVAVKLDSKVHSRR